MALNHPKPQLSPKPSTLNSGSKGSRVPQLALNPLNLEFRSTRLGLSNYFNKHMCYPPLLLYVWITIICSESVYNSTYIPGIFTSYDVRSSSCVSHLIIKRTKKFYLNPKPQPLNPKPQHPKPCSNCSISRHKRELSPKSGSRGSSRDPVLGTLHVRAHALSEGPHKGQKHTKHILLGLGFRGDIFTLLGFVLRGFWHIPIL